MVQLAMEVFGYKIFCLSLPVFIYYEFSNEDWILTDTTKKVIWREKVDEDGKNQSNWWNF